MPPFHYHPLKIKIMSKILGIGLSLILLLQNNPVLAEYVNPHSKRGKELYAERMGTDWSWALFGIIAFVLLLIAIFILVNVRLHNMKEKERLDKMGDDYYEKATWWDIFLKNERQHPLAEPIKHHNYDGIVELDNNPPSWFNWLFFLPIGTGILYLVYYHYLDLAPLQNEEYSIAMAAAEKDKPEVVIDFANLAPLTDQPSITAGEAQYKSKCSACHLDNGGGGVGPNLTDAYWLHGGDFPSIYQTIYDGVDGKGMAAWGEILLSKEIHEVASYIETLRNTNAEGKGPEGEEYKE